MWALWLIFALCLLGCHAPAARPLTAAEHDRLAAQAEQAAAEVGASRPAEADVYRQEAATHRAQAQALREAAMAACLGLLEQDIAHGPLHQPGAIARVEPLVETERVAKAEFHHLGGAVLVLRPAQGYSREWLQRLGRCHAARALSGERCNDKACPLDVPGVTATVESTGDGYLLTLRTEDPETARQVLERARGLATK